jgi:pyruvate dehydrogenase E2 component (dihydrolipoamide acetyltransferase)
MPKTVIMPKFGMTQEEATIVRWLVKEGERVEQGDPLCEVTTDKINMEVEAPGEGTLAGIRFAEGETVPVTEVIAYLLAEGESLPGAPTAAAVETRPAPPPSATGQPGETVKATPVARRVAAASALELAAIPGSGAAGRVTRQDVENYLVQRSARPGGKVPASPAARRIARQAGIDLGSIEGSGPQGRVQGWDVRAAAASRTIPSPAPPSPAPPSPAPPPPAPPAPGVPGSPPQAPPAGAESGALRGAEPQVIPLEGMRRTIAQRMQASAQQAPHIMLTLEIDMTRAIAMREDFNAHFGGGAPVSMSAVLVKACAAALRQHPLLNSYLRDDRILLMPQVNVGMAVALDEGLIVPVIREADRKGLYQIGQEVNDLSRRAREGKLEPQDVMDGTFTISNLGMFGVDHFTAIINPPQVAILAVGRIARRFVADEHGQPVLRPTMSVTLSVDHRAIDGAGAARFLNTLRDILETAGAQWG